MEATSVFFAVRSGNDVIPTIGESEKCFLWGPFTGYIVTSPAELSQFLCVIVFDPINPVVNPIPVL
jgi:hypothetical protein